MVEEGTGYQWQQGKLGKAGVRTTEGVGSLANPDLVEEGRVAPGDHRSKVSYVDGRRWSHQVKDRRESLELGDCLGEL